MSPLALGALASLAAGLATGVGALPVLFRLKPSERVTDGMLGFAAGVMLGATFFSLLLPAIEAGGPWRAVAGFLLGVALLVLADKLTPHLHVLHGREGPRSRLTKVWLFAFAVTIHNFPEGLAVGVGFGAGDVAGGLVLAAGIGLQNLPEGLAVALPLVGEGYSRAKALLIATATGLAEPLAGAVGAAAVGAAAGILPYALAFAAGAMLYVISDEIIPESHRRGHEFPATGGLVLGFMVMTLLDTLLG
ncbi:MAG: ZIP family metal transporter [Candidatus Bipolaricaulota bacterium]|nr:ZIP family metal transporter [Candidatus Bipolaricaulota bacterium]